MSVAAGRVLPPNDADLRVKNIVAGIVAEHITLEEAVESELWRSEDDVKQPMLNLFP
jgi:hypothetical protein